MANEKSESLAGRLLSKLGALKSDDIFDVSGNKVGSITDGKVIIDGIPTKRTIIFDDEPESTALS